MASLDSYFTSQGKSFDSYSKWLDQATPEELLAGGVGAGMLFDLYGRGDENISGYKLKAENYLRHNGFTLGSARLHSWTYYFDRNKALTLLLADYSGVSMMILNGSSSTNGLGLAKDASQVARGIIRLIHQEGISSRLLFDNIAGVKYEIKNYILTPEGFRIFQTANFNDSLQKVL